ncbi:MAG: hypothetical protein DDT38_01669 [Firmicutes bacterium]|nr:hypothetical protein [candidate division NPL-UPA2 bacterium]
MRIYRRRAKLYARLMRHWGGMLFGRSYWHAEQGPGRQFAPGNLLGYYNDLTAKAHWTGPVDSDGLPLNQDVQGRFICFPTTLLQKALGHWDRWLESGRTSEYNHDAFLNLAAWALRVQDENGGWPIWPMLGQNYASPYSAMTQGEGISVLVRAYSLSGEEAYLNCARRARELFLADVQNGGTCRSIAEGLVLEEVPQEPPNTVLNGWIFALYGIYDYLLVAKGHDVGCQQVEAALQASLRALVACLPQFNAGFWSYYDMSGNLASPFYHQLHIAQLKTLELTFPEHAESLRRWRQLFEHQAASRLNRTKALVLKAYQKLRRPPEVVLR